MYDLVGSLTHTRERLICIERVCKEWKRLSRKGHGWQDNIDFIWCSKYSHFSYPTLSQHLLNHHKRTINYSLPYWFIEKFDKDHHRQATSAAVAVLSSQPEIFVLNSCTSLIIQLGNTPDENFHPKNPRWNSNFFLLFPNLISLKLNYPYLSRNGTLQRIPVLPPNLRYLETIYSGDHNDRYFDDYNMGWPIQFEISSHQHLTHLKLSAGQLTHKDSSSSRLLAFVNETQKFRDIKVDRALRCIHNYSMVPKYIPLFPSLISLTIFERQGSGFWPHFIEKNCHNLIECTLRNQSFIDIVEFCRYCDSLKSLTVSQIYYDEEVSPEQERDKVNSNYPDNSMGFILAIPSTLEQLSLIRVEEKVKGQHNHNNQTEAEVLGILKEFRNPILNDGQNETDPNEDGNTIFTPWEDLTKLHTLNFIGFSGKEPQLTEFKQLINHLHYKHGQGNLKIVNRCNIDDWLLSPRIDSQNLFI
jgi:hypothetical protein